MYLLGRESRLSFENKCKTHRSSPTYLWNSLQCTVKTSIPMVLRQVDTSVGDLGHRRQQNSHRSANIKKGDNISVCFLCVYDDHNKFKKHSNILESIYSYVSSLKYEYFNDVQCAVIF